MYLTCPLSRLRVCLFHAAGSHDLSRMQRRDLKLKGDRWNVDRQQPDAEGMHNIEMAGGEGGGRRVQNFKY